MTCLVGVWYTWDDTLHSYRRYAILFGSGSFQDHAYKGIFNDGVLVSYEELEGIIADVLPEGEQGCLVDGEYCRFDPYKPVADWLEWNPEGFDYLTDFPANGSIPDVWLPIVEMGAVLGGEDGVVIDNRYIGPTQTGARQLTACFIGGFKLQGDAYVRQQCVPIITPILSPAVVTLDDDNEKVESFALADGTSLSWLEHGVTLYYVAKTATGQSEEAYNRGYKTASNAYIGVYGDGAKYAPES